MSELGVGSEEDFLKDRALGQKGCGRRFRAKELLRSPLWGLISDISWGPQMCRDMWPQK